MFRRALKAGSVPSDTLHNMGYSLRLSEDPRTCVDIAMQALHHQDKEPSGIRLMTVVLLANCLRGAGDELSAVTVLATVAQPVARVGQVSRGTHSHFPK